MDNNFDDNCSLDDKRWALEMKYGCDCMDLNKCACPHPYEWDEHKVNEEYKKMILEGKR